MRMAARFVLAAISVACWTATNEAMFISPRIIMFYGEPLRAPIYITGEHSRMFHDIEDPTELRVSGFSNRRFIKVAMFWGTQWDPYYFGKLPLKGLTPDMAGQHGRLYLADREGMPFLLQTVPRLKPVPLPTDPNDFSWGGPVPSEAVSLFKYYGVPTRIQ